MFNENPFQNHPVKLFLLKPSIKKTSKAWIFAFGADEAVKKELLSSNPDKIKINAWTKWKEMEMVLKDPIAAVQNKSITGGDLLDTEDDIEEIVLPGKQYQKAKEEPEDVKQEILLSDIIIFPEDRLDELKLKFSLCTGIPLYAMHVFTREGTIKYEFWLEEKLRINILKDYESKNKLFEFPLDVNIYPNKESIMIKNQELSSTYGEFYKETSIVDFFIVDLRSLVSNNTGLKNVLANDPLQIDLLYYSFVIKHFPITTLDMFKMMITDQNISEIYPDFAPTIKSLKKKFDAESELLERKYKLINQAGFIKFADNVLKKSIKGAVLDLATISKVSLDSVKLFNNLPTSSSMPISRVIIQQAGKKIVLTKINNSIDSVKFIYDEVKTKIFTNYYNINILVLKIDENRYLVIMLKNSGHYFIRYWGEESETDFSELKSFIIKHVNPVLQKINEFNRFVFLGSERITLLNKYNCVFTDMNINIVYSRSTTEGEFAQMKKALEQDFTAGIFRVSQQGEVMGTYTLLFVKGIVFTSKLETQNEYHVLLDTKLKEKWLEETAGKPVIIINRGSDVKIEISGLSQSEFNFFIQYFATRFYDIFKQLKAVEGFKQRGKISRIKLLHERDPELYNFKKQNTAFSYGRFCQQKYQPEILTNDEYASLTNSQKTSAIKYWNFTTQSPQWYRCPNSKFPHLNFHVDKHAKGYCMPCCAKKITIAETKISKYNSKYSGYVPTRLNINKICLEKHAYNSDDRETLDSRYILGYSGKLIEQGRLSYLPALINQYLSHNITNINSIQEIDEIELEPPISQVKRLYSSKKIKKSVKYAASRTMDPGEFPELFSELKIQSIKDNPKSDPQLYEEIINADLNESVVITSSKYFLKQFSRHKEHGRYVSTGYTTKSGKAHRIICGIYIAAKAWILRQNISVKQISASQIERCVFDPLESIKKEELKGKQQEIKEPSYYLYGIQQHMKTANLGAVFSIASALNLSVGKFIEMLTEKMKSVDYFKILVGGDIIKYFMDNEQLIREMKTVFMENKFSRFPYWNECIMDLVRLYLNIFVIQFDDNSLDTSGTNIKREDAIANFNMILPINVDNITDLYPDHSLREYIILVRKRKKILNEFYNTYLYYPIFIISPAEFFKGSKVNKKIYNIKDEIIQLTKKLYKNKMISDSGNIGLSDILDFVKAKNYKLLKLYCSFSDLCYAVEIQAKTTLLVPIKHSEYRYLENIPTQVVKTTNTINYKMNQTYKDVATFCKEMNEFIVSQTGASSEDNYSGNKELIKVEKFLVYSPIGQVNTDILGFNSNGLYFYFDKVDRESYGLLIKLYHGTKMFKFDIVKKHPGDIIHMIYYEPDSINGEIYKYINKEIKTSLPKILTESFNEFYKRQDVILKFMSDCDAERNLKIRDQIAEILKKQNSLIELQELRLSKNDYEKIAELIKTNQKKEFPNYIYGFDRLTLNSLKEITDGINTEDDKEIMDKLRKKLSAKIKDVLAVEYFSQEFINPLSRELITSGIWSDSNKLIKKNDDESVFVKVY